MAHYLSQTCLKPGRNVFTLLYTLTHFVGELWHTFALPLVGVEDVHGGVESTSE